MTGDTPRRIVPTDWARGGPGGDARGHLDLFHFWLFLHIMAVIVAFGPIFAFPLMGAHAKKHIEHAPAVAHLTELVERRKLSLAA